METPNFTQGFVGTARSLRAVLDLQADVDELEDEKVEDVCGMCKGEGEVMEEEEGNLVPCPECTHQEYSPEI